MANLKDTVVTGDVDVTGSLKVTGEISGSFVGTFTGGATGPQGPQGEPGAAGAIREARVLPHRNPLGRSSPTAVSEARLRP